jgi:hypothetical protein
VVLELVVEVHPVQVRLLLDQVHRLRDPALELVPINKFFPALDREVKAAYGGLHF